MLFILYSIINIDEQDLWHAQQRVLKHLSRWHADYKSSSKEFKGLFQQLLSKKVYSRAVLCALLEDWKKKWSTCSAIEKLSEKQMVILLGALYKNFTV